MNGKGRRRGWRRGIGKGMGRGWKGRGRGRCYRGGRGFGWRFSITEAIKQPIKSLKGLLTREVEPEVLQKAEEIYSLLPKRDCEACGYGGCYECALAIARGEAPPDACKVVGKKIKDRVEEILRR